MNLYFYLCMHVCMCVCVYITCICICMCEHMILSVIGKGGEADAILSHWHCVLIHPWWVGGVCGQANTCSVVLLYKMIIQYNYMCPYHSFSLLVLQFALTWCAYSSTLFIFSSILCVAISAIHPIIFIQDSNICIVYLYLYSYLYLCVFHLFYGGGDFIKFVISRVGFYLYLYLY